MAEVAKDPELAKAFGYIEPTPHPLSDRWDGADFDDEASKRRFEAVDLGWIGEDCEGVWLKRHPEAALLEHPELWDPVAAFEAGQIELTPEDYRTLSSVHYEAKMTLLLAFRREERRRLKRDAGSGS